MSRSNQRPGQALAVIVGAGGLGTAVARRLGATYRLLLADRDGDHLASRVTALCAEGHDASGVVCDVVDPGAVDALAAEAGATGPVRALVHVVGLSPSMADGPTILRVNLVGAALVADAFLGQAQRGTAAVFVASNAGHLIDPSPAVLEVLSDPRRSELPQRVTTALGTELSPGMAYQLSKAAVILMCRQRAAQWGQRGARIVSVSPGSITTPMGALEMEATPAKRTMLDLTPLAREGTMVEVADAVEFLVSDRASYITGTDLIVDGGVAAVLSSRQGS